MPPDGRGRDDAWRDGGAPALPLAIRAAVVVLWVALAGFVLFLAVLFWQHRSLANRSLTFRGTALEPPRTAPDFTLEDQSGRPFTLSRERGEVVVLFFGYAHCPDVCPTTLATLARAYRSLGSAAHDVRVAFVTVDPTRDTPHVLKRYVALFDPRFTALTGDPATLEPVYKAYGVWHERLPNRGSAAGYLVAHSSSIYLIDRRGELRVVHDWNDSAADIARDLKALLS